MRNNSRARNDLMHVAVNGAWRTARIFCVWQERQYAFALLTTPVSPASHGPVRTASVVPSPLAGAALRPAPRNFAAQERLERAKGKQDETSSYCICTSQRFCIAFSRPIGRREDRRQLDAGHRSEDRGLHKGGGDE